MGRDINIIQTPVFIIIFLFLFVSLFLFTLKRGKTQSNKILGFLFLCYGLWIWDIYATFYLYDSYPYLAYIFNNLLWLIGPGLLFYTYSVIYNNYPFRKKDLLHLIPFFLMFFLSIVSFHIQSTEFKRTFLEHAINDKSIFNWGSSAIILIHVLTYIIVSFIAIINYQRALTNILSNDTKIRVSWLKFMLIGSFLIFFSLISIVLNQYFNWHQKMPVESTYLLVLLLLIFITSILFKSMKQPEIFMGLTVEQVKINNNKGENSLPKEISNRYAEKLNEYMNLEKPYLDPDLTLTELAERLDIKVKDLSQVINNNFELRFFDYINKYRIQEAKALIENPPDPKMTILEIMYQVGFNSKSSFNTSFKKFIGMTPSEVKIKSRTIRNV